MKLNEIKIIVERYHMEFNKKISIYNPIYFTEKNGDVWSDGKTITKEGETYTLIYVERGKIKETVVSDDVYDILYRIANDLTLESAFDYEFIHRIPNKDGRRIAFPKQLEMIAKLDKRFVPILEKEQRDILLKRPFQDRG